MENVTDRTSNPFGMSPPCERACAEDVPAVFGYGDANADVHVIGDHPGVHGGGGTGVPFTETDAGLAVQSILQAVDLLADPGPEPALRNCFWSYLHACCPPEDGEPTAADYADLERFFDSELRAIAAHVLVPVGERAIAHVLENYTAKAGRFVLDGDGSGLGQYSEDEREAEADREGVSLDLDALHAREVTGSGWLVLPLRDPAEWSADDRETAVDALAALLERDYRQITDLGRFLATDDPYYVR